MNVAEKLNLTSHVGRDLLAAAASFKNEAAVGWEYVVNSLQYVDEGVLPKVHVVIKPRLKSMEIRDNGRGMEAEGLRQFFTMHGENVDRLRGRAGRGKFGTGKSAAFGIGKLLRVDTVRNGIRNVVELHRDMIEKSTGEDIPLKWIVQNEKTDFPNGTTVAIEEIFLPKLKTNSIIDYVERHLQIFRALKPDVAVNEHVCQYREPTITESRTFKPNVQQAAIIGDVELEVKVAAAPLPEVEQGVAISSGHGNLVAIETGGIERKDFGNYLFGHVDVPALEHSDSPMEPYDPTRSLQLNPQHPVAAALLAFVGASLEEVRREQVAKLNEAKKTEQARRLNQSGQEIAELLNKDFEKIMGRLQDIRSASARAGVSGAQFGGSAQGGVEEGVWVEGIAQPGEVETATGTEESPASEKVANRPDPEIARRGELDPDGSGSVDPAGGQRGKKQRPRGGFSVDYRDLGADAGRSKYDRNNLAILINLSHPVIKNVLKSNTIEDPEFRRLSYEIAFTEYSIALGYEMADQDPDIPADDLLYEIRTTLNRVSTAAASLYA